MGWTSSLQRLIPRQLSKKSIGSSNGNINSSSNTVVDKQPRRGQGAVESASAAADEASKQFSPSFLAANMSSLCNEKRLLEESNNVVTLSSIRKSRRQSQKASKNDTTNDDSTADDDDEDWQDDIILDPAAVPNNNHLMVNSERDKHYYCSSSTSSGSGSGTKLQHLSRSRYLDMLARAHAAEMAKLGMLKHSVETLEELQKKLDSLEVGENVLRGATLDEMHKMSMMDNNSKTSSSWNSCRSNILHPSYSEFGMGTARSSRVDDKRLYMVQIFRQHDTWKNSFVPSSLPNANIMQQQLLQLQQQDSLIAPVVDTAAAVPNAQDIEGTDQQKRQHQEQPVVESEDVIETSCCVHLVCMQE